MHIKELQSQLQAWTNRNFGATPPHRPLLGVGEELGELAEADHNATHLVEMVKALGRLHHAHLKGEQNIRLNENHTVKARDAVGDLFIYLTDYCEKRGWSLDEIVSQTWAEVSQRDWKKNANTGAA